MTVIKNHIPALSITQGKQNIRHEPTNLAAAKEFEAVILAEMLRTAGAGETASTFGGGIGEDQFSSFLIDEYARKIAARGGIGIAEIVIRSMPHHSLAED